MNLPACSGPCQQGKHECKTRDACGLPSDADDDEMTPHAKAFFLAALWLIVAAMAFGLAMSL